MKQLTEKQKQELKKNLAFLGASVFMGLLLMATALPGTLSFQKSSSNDSYGPVDPVVVLGDKAKNRGNSDKDNSPGKPDKEKPTRSDSTPSSRGNNNDKENGSTRPANSAQEKQSSVNEGNNQKQSPSKKKIKKDLEILPGEDVRAPRGQNAQEIKAKNKKISSEIKAVAKKESPQVAKKLESIAQQQEQTVEEAADSIEEIEKRGGFKRFLAGSDYKNLGQLRSSLVHNRNQIRQLTQTMQQISDPENQAVIAEQIESLMQERERMRVVIEENEEGFSLLGWAFRFMNDYEETNSEELSQEEEELEEEIEEALKELEEEEEIEEVEEEEVEVQGDRDMRSVFE